MGRRGLVAAVLCCALLCGPEHWYVDAKVPGKLVKAIWDDASTQTEVDAAEVKRLRQEAWEMFDHGYTNYMKHAFPKDNLLPISCGGKDWQGGLAITLVDSLDALMLLNRKQDVLDSMELVRRELHFDKDIKVHVFETVIRVLGGLLSGHMLLDRNPGMVDAADPHAAAAAAAAALNRTQQAQHLDPAEAQARARGAGDAHLLGGGEVSAGGQHAEEQQLERRQRDQGQGWQEGSSSAEPGEHGGGSEGNGAGPDTGAATAPYTSPGDESTSNSTITNDNSTNSSSHRQKPSAYDGIFLRKAVELADLLLPAFDTPSGLPALFVHLKTGPVHDSFNSTCTACAGTLLLELGMLTALTGDPVYLEKAEFAAKALYDRRSRLGLVGASLNVVNSQWASRESTIGPGSDSYYEYLLKAYLMFGKSEYLDWFAELYGSTMRWMQIPGTFKGYSWMVDVHMDNGRLSRPFVSSLGAFWPGMQALAGQEREAVELHANFTAAWRTFGWLPEVFGIDLSKVHPEDPGYNLRPEHIESTYLLHCLTQNPYYLRVASNIQSTLHAHNRVQCGYTQINHVDTGEHGDLMESYFLSETAKYLYLMFSDAPGLIDYYVLTTEGHLMPPVPHPDSLDLDRLRRRHVRRQRRRGQQAATKEQGAGQQQQQQQGEQAGAVTQEHHGKPGGVAAVRAAVDAIFAAVAAVSGHHSHQQHQHQHAPSTHARGEQVESAQHQRQPQDQHPHEGAVDLDAAAATVAAAAAAAASTAGGDTATTAAAAAAAAAAVAALAEGAGGGSSSSGGSGQWTPESLAAAVHALRQAAEGNESALTGHGAASSHAAGEDGNDDADDEAWDEAGDEAAEGDAAAGGWASELPVPQPVPENCAKICTPPPEAEQAAEEARLRAAFPLLGFRRRDAELVRHRRCVACCVVTARIADNPPQDDASRARIMKLPRESIDEVTNQQDGQQQQQNQHVLAQVVCTIKVFRDGSLSCNNVRGVTPHDAQHGVPYNAVILQMSAVPDDPQQQQKQQGQGQTAGQQHKSGRQQQPGQPPAPDYGLVAVRGGLGGETSLVLEAMTAHYGPILADATPKCLSELLAAPVTHLAGGCDGHLQSPLEVPLLLHRWRGSGGQRIGRQGGGTCPAYLRRRMNKLGRSTAPVGKVRKGEDPECGLVSDLGPWTRPPYGSGAEGGGSRPVRRRRQPLQVQVEVDAAAEVAEVPVAALGAEAVHGTGQEAEPQEQEHPVQLQHQNQDHDQDEDQHYLQLQHQGQDQHLQYYQEPEPLEGLPPDGFASVDAFFLARDAELLREQQQQQEGQQQGQQLQQGQQQEQQQDEGQGRDEEERRISPHHLSRMDPDGDIPPMEYVQLYQEVEPLEGLPPDGFASVDAFFLARDAELLREQQQGQLAAQLEQQHRLQQEEPQNAVAIPGQHHEEQEYEYDCDCGAHLAPATVVPRALPAAGAAAAQAAIAPAAVAGEVAVQEDDDGGGSCGDPDSYDIIDIYVEDDEEDDDDEGVGEVAAIDSGPDRGLGMVPVLPGDVDLDSQQHEHQHQHQQPQEGAGAATPEGNVKAGGQGTAPTPVPAQPEAPAQLPVEPPAQGRAEAAAKSAARRAQEDDEDEYEDDDEDEELVDQPLWRWSIESHHDGACAHAPTATGALVLAEPRDGCEQAANPAALAGAVAVVVRGGCSFVAKTLNMQAAGAVGVLVLNTQPPGELLNMAADDSGQEPEIPALLLGGAESRRLLQALAAAGVAGEPPPVGSMAALPHHMMAPGGPARRLISGAAQAPAGQGAAAGGGGGGAEGTCSAAPVQGGGAVGAGADSSTTPSEGGGGSGGGAGGGNSAGGSGGGGGGGGGNQLSTRLDLLVPSGSHAFLQANVVAKGRNLQHLFESVLADGRAVLLLQQIAQTNAKQVIASMRQRKP